MVYSKAKAVAFFILSVFLALAITAFTTEERAYQNSMIVLHDDKCDICGEEFNKAVSAIKKAVEGRLKIVELSPYNREGEIIYKKLVDNNVAVLPLIIFTKDVAEPTVFEELNKAFIGAGITANLVDAGEFFVLNPKWPIRRHIPGKEEVQVSIFAGKNVDTAALKTIAFAVADNVVIKEGNVEEGYLLRVKGPPAVMGAFSKFIPLSIHTSSSLEMPIIRVDLSVSPEFAEEINAMLSLPNIRVVGVRDENSSSIAVISTDYPEVLARIFPGARIYPDRLVIDKTTELFFDVYLGGEEDGNIISELLDVVSRTDVKTSVLPHYLVTRMQPEEMDRAVFEYCVFLNYGSGSWLGFTKMSRESCGDANCWKEIAKGMGLDMEKMENCEKSKEEILRFLMGEEASKPSIRVNSWYVWTPGKKKLRELVRSFILLPCEVSE